MRAPLRSWCSIAIGAALTALGGCTTPVVADLEEREANEALVVLDGNGVAATKESDPAHEARFRVVVPEADAPAAVAALQARGLPHQEAPGVLDALGEGSLVPSRSSEHARLIAGIAGDLERSLTGLDGVLSARVHLAVSPKDGLSIDPSPLVARASVLIRHRGATLPIGAADVQRLVAGAVPGLDADRVSVIASPVPAVAAGAAPNLTRLGPIAVARSSLAPLRWVVGSAVLANLLLLSALLTGWLKLRRTRHELEAARGGGVPEAGR